MFCFSVYLLSAVSSITPNDETRNFILEKVFVEDQSEVETTTFGFIEILSELSKMEQPTYREDLYLNYTLSQIIFDKVERSLRSRREGGKCQEELASMAFKLKERCAVGAKIAKATRWMGKREVGKYKRAHPDMFAKERTLEEATSKIAFDLSRYTDHVIALNQKKLSPETAAFLKRHLEDRMAKDASSDLLLGAYQKLHGFFSQRETV